MSDEKIDHAALIAEAKRPAVVETEHGPMHRNDHLLIERLVAALEAAQPAVSDDVKDLLFRARHHATSFGIDAGSYEFIDRLCDALEAAQQAPAVDREALELVCVAEVERLAPNNQHAGDIGSSVASALIAFGVLQDAAAVRKDGDRDGVRRMADQIDRDLFRFAQQEIGQAELLDRLADLVALARAQQVREGI